MTKPERDVPTPDDIVSAEDLALLLGVELSALRAEERRQRQRLRPGRFQIPKEWERQGRRIAQETMAATGQEDMSTALEYLRAKAAQNRTNP